MKKLKIAGVFGLLLVMGIAGVVAQAQEDLSLDVAFGVRVIARLAEAYIGGLVDAMHVMTATANLRTGDWDQMQGLLAQFQESELSYDAWFLKPDGTYYKVESGLASANLSDRGYFAKVMAGETTQNDLVVSRSTGRKSMVLTAPIFNGPTVIGALGVTLYLDDFSAFLADKVRLPESVRFYGYDTDDLVICVHSNPDLLLEPESSSGITLARGGIQISTAIGWTFVLGTAE
jgi:hypothetical protein